jgi:hypothetical protein
VPSPISHGIQALLVPGPVPAAQYREDVPTVTAEAFIINEKNNEPEINNMEKHPSTKNLVEPLVIISKIIMILYLKTFLVYFFTSKKRFHKGHCRLSYLILLKLK